MRCASDAGQWQIEEWLQERRITEIARRKVADNTTHASNKPPKMPSHPRVTTNAPRLRLTRYPRAANRDRGVGRQKQTFDRGHATGGLVYESISLDICTPRTGPWVQTQAGEMSSDGACPEDEGVTHVGAGLRNRN